jgi:glutathione S-transferase
MAGADTAGERKAKLYGIRGSAPSFSPELMLRHKGIPYRRVNLIPDRHRRTLPAKGFPGRTVPALIVAGRRAQTNGAIARLLDELIPERPLLPLDEARREAVEEAERFGDEVFQPAVRRMIIWSVVTEPRSVRPDPSIGPLPIRGNAWLRRRLTRNTFRHYGIDAETVRGDFEALPGMLDRLDGYASRGVLNSTAPSAADFEIVPLVAALLGVADVAADLGARPVASLTARLMPAQPLGPSGLRRPSPRPLPPRPQPLTTPRSRRFSPK